MVKILVLFLAIAGGLPFLGFGSRLFPPLIGLSGRQRRHDGSQAAFLQATVLPETSRRRVGSFLQIQQRAPGVSAPVQTQHFQQHLHSVALGYEMPEGPDSVLLDTAVMQRGIEELAISNNAREAAQLSQKSAAASQQEFVAKNAIMSAKEAYAKVRMKPIESRTQLILARRYAERARMYANHAAKVAFAARNLVNVAAEKALEATRGWIKQDAEESAKATAADNSANFAAHKADRIATAVAAAAEPCHLALLRTQKFCAEAYSKAKGTQVSTRNLMIEAKKIAGQAQVLQSGGDGLDAQTTMAIAINMMNEAETMRQNGIILYNQANTACSGAGYYQGCEQQAAANAAANQIINTPMELPKV